MVIGAVVFINWIYHSGRNSVLSILVAAGTDSIVVAPQEYVFANDIVAVTHAGVTILYLKYQPWKKNLNEVQAVHSVNQFLPVIAIFQLRLKLSNIVSDAATQTLLRVSNVVTAPFAHKKYLCHWVSHDNEIIHTP